MNKTLSILPVLFAVACTAFAKTPDEPASGISVLRKGETIRLLYKGEKQTDVKVYILNEENEIVFTEKIRSTDGFIRPYNFSKLPQGNYSFELIDNSGRRQVEQVNYKLERQPKTMHVVQVAGTTDKFVLSIPNEGSSNVSITIYDDLNRIMHTEKQTVTGDFARVYNIKDYKGEVTFEVTDGNGRRNSFTKDSW
jgi:flagellar hook assembly protein FlgD